MMIVNWKKLYIQINQYNKQSGQAFYEFTIIVIPLVLVALSILMVSGLSINFDKKLLVARNNAEKLAMHIDEETSALGQEYGAWSRTKVEAKPYVNDVFPTDVEIPFGINSHVSYRRDNTIANSLDALNNPIYSIDQTMNPGDSNSVSAKNYQYKEWKNPNNFSPQFNNDFYKSFPIAESSLLFFVN